MTDEGIMKFTRDKNHLSYIADVGCDFFFFFYKGLAAAIFSRSVKVGNDVESLRRRIEFKDFLIAFAADEVKSIYAAPSHDVELLRLLTRKEACWKHTAEEKLYKELSTGLKNQAICNSKNLDGTVVALYCPNYVTGLNAPGWHLHFVSPTGQRAGTFWRWPLNWQRQKLIRPRSGRLTCRKKAPPSRG